MISRRTIDPHNARTTITENGLTYVFWKAAPRKSAQQTDKGAFFDYEGQRAFLPSGIIRDLPRTDKIIEFPLKTTPVIVDNIFEELELNAKEPDPDMVGIWRPVFS